MEFEQIIKHLDRLDEEHRKNSKSIAAIEKRFTSFEAELRLIKDSLKNQDENLSRIIRAASKMEQLDKILEQNRQERNKLSLELDIQQEENRKEIEKRVEWQFDSTLKALDFRKMKEDVTKLLQIQSLFEKGANRLSSLTAEGDSKLSKFYKTQQEIEKNQQEIEESRQQESKRLTNLQAELNIVRKRMDEFREKTEAFSGTTHMLDARLTELLSAETEKRKAQTAFLETNAHIQDERDRKWREWEERFEMFRTQTESLETQLREWEITQKALKRAQSSYDEVNQKYERRINEISEMQRLAGDRFRQDWVTFKSDDQKRWTSYTLSQDEQNRDMRIDVTKLKERTTFLEDLTQTHQDILQQLKESNEKMLQAFLAQIHEYLNTYERIMGVSG